LNVHLHRGEKNLSGTRRYQAVPAGTTRYARQFFPLSSGNKIYKLIMREYAGISGIKREVAHFPPAYSHLIPLKLPPIPTFDRISPLRIWSSSFSLFCSAPDSIVKELALRPMTLDFGPWILDKSESAHLHQRPRLYPKSRFCQILVGTDRWAVRR